MDIELSACVSLAPEAMAQARQDVNADASQVVKLCFTEVRHVMTAHDQVGAVLFDGHVALLRIAIVTRWQQVAEFICAATRARHGMIDGVPFAPLDSVMGQRLGFE